MITRLKVKDGVLTAKEKSDNLFWEAILAGCATIFPDSGKARIKAAYPPDPLTLPSQETQELDGLVRSSE